MTSSTSIPKHIEETLENCTSLPRRSFLKSAGLLAVSFGAGISPLVKSAAAQTTAPQTAGPYIDPDFHQLDSWIVVHQDNTATFYVGKTDCGQGTGTSFRQLMADEMDIAYEKTTCIMAARTIRSTRAGPVVRPRWRETRGP
jgi:nicotinate dehydrogenase subunit B